MDVKGHDLTRPFLLWGTVVCKPALPSWSLRGAPQIAEPSQHWWAGWWAQQRHSAQPGAGTAWGRGTVDPAGQECQDSQALGQPCPCASLGPGLTSGRSTLVPSLLLTLTP